MQRGRGRMGKASFMKAERIEQGRSEMGHSFSSFMAVATGAAVHPTTHPSQPMLSPHLPCTPAVPSPRHPSPRWPPAPAHAHRQSAAKVTQQRQQSRAAHADPGNFTNEHAITDLHLEVLLILSGSTLIGFGEKDGSRQCICALCHSNTHGHLQSPHCPLPCAATRLPQLFVQRRGCLAGLQCGVLQALPLQEALLCKWGGGRRARAGAR